MSRTYEVYADGALVLSTTSGAKAEAEYRRRYEGGAEVVLSYPPYRGEDAEVARETGSHGLSSRRTKAGPEKGPPPTGARERGVEPAAAATSRIPCAARGPAPRG